MKTVPGTPRAVSGRPRATIVRNVHVVELTLECGHVLMAHIPCTRWYGEPSPFSRSGRSKTARRLAEAKTAPCVACGPAA